MPPLWFYNLMYRFGAPWEMGVRDELVSLVESGRLTPGTLPPGRAIDLGCGSGANAFYLAEHGFSVTGVDYSPVGLEKARAAAAKRGLEDKVRLIRGDLTSLNLSEEFDLLVDYSTLDDQSEPKARLFGQTYARLARPGAALVLWCFYGDRSALPRFGLRRPSQLVPHLEEGDEERFLGHAFDFERLPEPAPGSGFACFLGIRR